MSIEVGSVVAFAKAAMDCVGQNHEMLTELANDRESAVQLCGDAVTKMASAGLIEAEKADAWRREMSTHKGAMNVVHQLIGELESNLRKEASDDLGTPAQDKYAASREVIKESRQRAYARRYF